MATTKIADENISAKTYWSAITQSDEQTPNSADATTKALLDFASPLLEKATIKSVDDVEHSALFYAMYLYIKADSLVNTQSTLTITNMLAQSAILVALQECCFRDAFWSYGSRVLFEIKKLGIKLNRTVISAFLAQDGTWSTNRSKGDLLSGNIIAVGIYCARLQVLCQDFLGVHASMGGTEEALEKIEVQQELKSPQEIIGYYLENFAIPYLESVGAENATNQMAVFRKYLDQQSDFYIAPCSTKYHLNRDGGLAEHTIHVLMQMLWLTLPATRQQLGACVLTAIGHDLCKINVYKKQYKSKKIYIAEGEEVPTAAYVKEDAGGRFYWGDDWYYEFKDAMPFGHGRKSAYILMGFFPEIGADVFSAVDGHMGDDVVNKNFMYQFAENPMALNVHIADILATYIDEHNQ